MFKIAMEVDAALSAAWPSWRMPRGNLVHSLVRSFVRTCIRTTGQSQRVAAARAASRAVAARTAVRPTVRGTAPRSAGYVPATVGPVSESKETASPSAPLRRPTSAASPARRANTGAAVSLPVSEPAFARVSSRRGAQPATLNPVRIYATASRTVIVGNLGDVANLLDKSIEREHAQSIKRTEAVIA